MSETNYDEAKVLEGARETVNLGGASVELREPVRSRARQCRPKFAVLANKMNEAAKNSGEGAEDDITDDVIDALKTFSPELEGIDYDECRDSEILDAFFKCMWLLNDPLVSTGTAFAERAMTRETNKAKRLKALSTKA